MITDATIKRGRDSIIKNLTHICGSKEMAEDAFQNACISCFKAKGEYMVGSLYFVAKRKVIDLQRRKKREAKWVYKDHIVNEDFDVLINVKDDRLSHIEEAENQEYIDFVLRLVKFIPKEQQAVVELRLRNLKFQEIAEELNLSIMTVIGQNRYAIKNLRKLIFN